jgi:hypothetical protein
LHKRDIRAELVESQKTTIYIRTMRKKPGHFLLLLQLKPELESAK